MTFSKEGESNLGKLVEADVGEEMGLEVSILVFLSKSKIYFL